LKTATVDEARDLRLGHLEPGETFVFFNGGDNVFTPTKEPEEGRNVSIQVLSFQTGSLSWCDPKLRVARALPVEVKDGVVIFKVVR